MVSYAVRVKRLLSPSERRLYAKLRTPEKIQDFLDSLPVNFETKGETYFSPRMTLKEKTAHCFEAALLAASLLAYHGEAPLLMDLRVAAPDEDHVVALFKKNGRWGAISKTNHVILRWRDAVYATPRELAMSYFNEYVMEENGRRTLRTHSKPFDLRRYAPERWVTATEDLGWLVNTLDASPHSPIAPRKNLLNLRRASRIELKALALVEQPDPRAKKKKNARA